MTLTYSAVFLLVFFTFVSGAWNIPCSEITLVKNANLTELEGDWLTEAMYHVDDNVHVRAANVCSYHVINTNDATFNITTRSGSDPTIEPYKYLSFNVEPNGIWARQGKGDEDMRLLTVSPSGYFTITVCREDEETKTMNVYLVMSLRRAEKHRSDSDLETLHNNVKTALKVQQLYALQVNSPYC